MTTRTFHLSFFCTLVLALFFGTTLIAYAGTVQWSGWQSALGSDCLQDDGGCTIVNQTIQYGADAVNASTGASVCGGSVPMNTAVNFNFAPHVPSDYSWFYTGYAHDSPYGMWKENLPTMTTSGIYAEGGGEVSYQSGSGTLSSPYADIGAYAAGIAKPPAQSVSGISSLFDCASPNASGSVSCTAKHTGSATALFTFASTYGSYSAQSLYVQGIDSNGQQFYTTVSLSDFLANENSYYQSLARLYEYYRNTYPPYAYLYQTPSFDEYVRGTMGLNMPFTVPPQSISCPITVTPPTNRPPNKPTVETSAQCTVGQDFSIGMTGTDPDGDRLYYQVYWLWDTDKTAYERLPASGTMPSGQLLATTHRYATSGAHAVAVKAVDTGGNVSQTSQQLSFNCAAAPPPPTVTIRADAASIQVGQSTGIHATFAIGTGDTMTSTALNEVPPAAAEFTIPGYGYSPVARYDYVFTPATTGTYVFKPYTITSYYNSWNSWGQSATVTVTPPACVDHFYCSGNDQRHVDASCADTFRQTCSYGCGDGRCLPPPTPTFNPNGHLRVNPALVKAGDTTKVRWDVSNVTTCTVTGDNLLHDTWTVIGSLGNGWTSTAGATGKTSSPITERTTFTLSCIGLDSSAINESATVNILPVFEEQ